MDENVRTDDTECKHHFIHQVLQRVRVESHKHRKSILDGNNFLVSIGYLRRDKKALRWRKPAAVRPNWRSLFFMTWLTMIMLAVTACGTSNRFNGLAKSTYGKVPTGSVTLVLNQKTYPLSGQGMTYTVINHSTKPITFGFPVELDKYHNGSWYNIPLVANGTWNKGEKSLKPGGTYSQDFGLIIYGYQFTKGSYRIVKTYSTPNNHKEIAISAKFRLN